MLTEKRTTSPSTETVHVEGTFDEVVERIRKAMDEYPPCGYGTVVTMLSLQYPGPLYHANIVRSLSCD